jgi:hypothetical protein
MTIIQGLYRNSTATLTEHIVREPGSSRPTYARSTQPAPLPGGPDLPDHITEMLRRSEGRATALIQTLVINRSTSGLMSAFRRDPSLITASAMLTLADCQARQEFIAALGLRPDIVTADFLIELGERKSAQGLVQAALHARPDLACSVAAKGSAE